MTGKASPDELSGGPLRRAVLRHPWAFGIAIGLLFFPVLRCATAGEAEPLPDLGPAPAFVLEDASGGSVTRDSLRGHVWIAHPYVSPCEGPCLATLSAARELRGRFERQGLPVQILGWPIGSVAPGEHRILIERHGAKDGVWRLLVAENSPAPLAALQGTPLGEPDLTRLVVVSADSQIRARLGIGSLGLDEASSLAVRLVSEAAQRPSQDHR